MKKLFTVLAIFLAAATATASGKITIQPMYNTTSEKVLAPQIGLSIYQKFPMNAAYVGWFGTGEPLVQATEEDNLRWYTMKNSIEAYVGNFTVAPGIQHIWNAEDGFEKKHEIIMLKVGYQIW